MAASVLAAALLIGPSCTNQLDRSNVDAAQKRYLLAADYYAKGMIPAAQEELRQALALDPQNHEALYLTGLISMRQAVETQDLATRWECLPPREARVQMEDVDARMRSAEAQYRKAVQVRPDYSEAWNALAAVALHFRRWDEAIANSDRALGNAAYGTPWLALVNQGVAYLEKKEYLRAGKVLREALAQNARLCVARWRLGQVYFSQQDLDRARQELQAVVDDQNCPIQEAYLLLGQILVQLGERARAEDIFAACRDMAPRSCVARECRLAD